MFYREAGPKDAPTIVMLHGFPSSSREYDTLIPPLATRYHLIAPDFPGFGQSDAPPPSAYPYTFDHLAQTTEHLLQALKIERYSLYIHDYGAPVGMRLILAHPERLQALITQNGNVYQAGLGAKWSKIAQYWADPAEHPEVINAFLSPEATKERHIAGTSHPDRYNPDTWTDEIAHLSRPGQRDIQAALLTTTGPMSPPIPSGRRGSGSISRRPWWPGGRTIRPSSRQVRRRSALTSRRRRSTCWTLAISLSMKRPTRPPR